MSSTKQREAQAAFLHADIRLKFGRKGAHQEMYRAQVLMLKAGIKDLDRAIAYLDENCGQLWAEIKARSALSSDELTAIIEDKDYRKLARVIETLGLKAIQPR